LRAIFGKYILFYFLFFQVFFTHNIATASGPPFAYVVSIARRVFLGFVCWWFFLFVLGLPNESFL